MLFIINTIKKERTVKVILRRFRCWEVSVVHHQMSLQSWCSTPMKILAMKCYPVLVIQDVIGFSFKGNNSVDHSCCQMHRPEYPRYTCSRVQACSCSGWQLLSHQLVHMQCSGPFQSWTPQYYFNDGQLQNTVWSFCFYAAFIRQVRNIFLPHTTLDLLLRKDEVITAILGVNERCMFSVLIYCWFW